MHDEAEVLEHTISDRLLEGIDERLGRPRFDPHGDAIPDAEGRVERVRFVLLAHAAPGHEGRVLRVSDRDAPLLRHLEERGVEVGASVRVISREILEGDSGPIALPEGAAAAVWLSA